MRNLIHSFRKLVRDKFYTLINIIGLTFGLTCSTIFLIYVHHELTYDGHHEHADRIYRVAQNFVTSGKPKKFAVTSPALGPALHREYPQIEAFVRIKPTYHLLVACEDAEFYEEFAAFTDSNIFSVFSYEFLSGDPLTCLSDPGSIVISESLAEKYFGRKNPLGEALLVENRLPLTVTGIIG